MQAAPPWWILIGSPGDHHGGTDRWNGRTWVSRAEEERLIQAGRMPWEAGEGPPLAAESNTQSGGAGLVRNDSIASVASVDLYQHGHGSVNAAPPVNWEVLRSPQSPPSEWGQFMANAQPPMPPPVPPTPQLPFLQHSAAPPPAPTPMVFHPPPQPPQPPQLPPTPQPFFQPLTRPIPPPLPTATPMPMFFAGPPRPPQIPTPIPTPQAQHGWRDDEVPTPTATRPVPTHIEFHPRPIAAQPLPKAAPPLKVVTSIEYVAPIPAAADIDENEGAALASPNWNGGGMPASDQDQGTTSRRQPPVEITYTRPSVEADTFVPRRPVEHEHVEPRRQRPHIRTAVSESHTPTQQHYDEDDVDQEYSQERRRERSRPSGESDRSDQEDQPSRRGPSEHSRTDQSEDQLQAQPRLDHRQRYQLSDTPLNDGPARLPTVTRVRRRPGRTADDQDTLQDLPLPRGARGARPGHGHTQSFSGFPANPAPGHDQLDQLEESFQSRRERRQSSPTDARPPASRPSARLNPLGEGDNSSHREVRAQHPRGSDQGLLQQSPSRNQHPTRPFDTPQTTLAPPASGSGGRPSHSRSSSLGSLQDTPPRIVEERVRDPPAARLPPTKPRFSGLDAVRQYAAQQQHQRTPSNGSQQSTKSPPESSPSSRVASPSPSRPPPNQQQTKGPQPRERLNAVEPASKDFHLREAERLNGRSPSPIVGSSRTGTPLSPSPSHSSPKIPTLESSKAPSPAASPRFVARELPRQATPEAQHGQRAEKIADPVTLPNWEAYEDRPSPASASTTSSTLPFGERQPPARTLTMEIDSVIASLQSPEQIPPVPQLRHPPPTRPPPTLPTSPTQPTIPVAVAIPLPPSPSSDVNAPSLLGALAGPYDSSVNDRDVRDYALRTAYLADLLDHQPAAKPKVDAIVVRPVTVVRQPSSTAQRFWGKTRATVSSLISDSKAEVGKEDASDRFPREALQPLIMRLDAVSRSPSDADHGLFARSAAAFLLVLQDPTSAKPYVDGNGKISKIILHYSRTASESKKDQFPDIHLYQLISAFVSELRKAIAGVPGVSTALMANLDTRLADFSRKPDPSTALPRMPINPADMEMVSIVGELFGMSPEDLTRELADVRKFCTERAAYFDVKLCMDNLARKAKHPGNRDDFDSDTSYNRWRAEESSSLIDDFEELSDRDPSLNPSQETRSTYIFIPPLPKPFYTRLLQLALARDQQRPGRHPEDVLSARFDALLRFCAERWRLLQTFRFTVYFEAIAGRFVTEDAPIESILDSFVALDSIEYDYDRWPWSDRSRLLSTLQSLFDFVLPKLLTIFDDDFDQKLVQCISRIRQNVVFREDAPNLSATIDKFKGDLREKAQHAFNNNSSFSTPLPTLDHVFALSEYTLRGIMAYEKSYKEAVLGIKIPALFAGVAAGEYVKVLEASKKAIADFLAPSGDPNKVVDVGQCHAIYMNTLFIKEMHDTKFPTLPLVIDFLGVFGPYVDHWLAAAVTGLKAELARGIAVDPFEAGPGKFKESKSIVGFTHLCSDYATLYSALKWPIEDSNARFVGRLGLTISQQICAYGVKMIELLTRDLIEELPSPIDADEADNANPWNAVIKFVGADGKKVPPYKFLPKTLVKLNNVFAARNFLNNTMFSALDGDKMAEIVKRSPGPRRTGIPDTLFVVKVVRAEKLGFVGEGRKALPNAYVHLVRRSDGRYLKGTAPVFQSSEPRWSHTLEVPVAQEMWIRVILVNRGASGASDSVIGETVLLLKPAHFNGPTPVNVWLQLSTPDKRPFNGRVLLRLSCDSMSDDIPYHFGQVSRILQRMEKDMARRLVDKMVPYVKGCLSLSNIQAVVKPGLKLDAQFEAARAAAARAAQVDLVGIGQRFRKMVADQFDNNRERIPEVVHEAPRDHAAEAAQKKADALQKDRTFTDRALSPIVPLVSYIMETYEITCRTLPLPAWDLTMMQLWKEMLRTMEAFMLPTLSDEQSDMHRLTQAEMEIAVMWLQHLMKRMQGDGDGLPEDVLQNSKYQALLMASMFSNWETPQLRGWVTQLLTTPAPKPTKPAPASSSLGRSKSVYNQRNLPELRQRKASLPPEEQSKQTAMNDTDKLSCEVILRLLRLRPGQQDFLQDSILRLETMEVMKGMEQLKKKNEPLTEEPEELR